MSEHVKLRFLKSLNNTTYGFIVRGTERTFPKDYNTEQWLKLGAVEIIVDAPITYVPSQPIAPEIPDEITEYEGEKDGAIPYPKVIPTPKPMPLKGAKK